MYFAYVISILEMPFALYYSICLLTHSFTIKHEMVYFNSFPFIFYVFRLFFHFVCCSKKDVFRKIAVMHGFLFTLLHFKFLNDFLKQQAWFSSTRKKYTVCFFFFFFTKYIPFLKPVFLHIHFIKYIILIFLVLIFEI